MCKLLSLLVGLFLLNFVTCKIDIAGRVKHCLDSERNIDSCLGQLLNDIRPFLRTGIPEINVPILEPISLKNLSFAQREGAINIRARFRDVFVGGFSNFTLESIKTNLDTLELQVKVYIPQLRVTGRYILDGNLILLPITGDGPFRASLQDINAAVASNIVIKNDAGKERLGLANTKVDFQLRSARARLRNLFNGDPILGETVNHFINNNDQMILREVQPAVSKDLGKLVEVLLDSALSSLPVSLVRPQNPAAAAASSLSSPSAISV